MAESSQQPDTASTAESSRRRRKRAKVGLSITEMVIFAMFGAMMYGTTLALQAVPNVHLLGLFIVTLTVVYRRKALYPIYVFVFLNGLQWGFNTSWVPYLYVWTVLWGVVMLLPKKMPLPVAAVVYPVVSALHGFLFGVIYAPAQALLFGLDFRGMLTWIVVGLQYDVIHGIGNLCSGLLIVPLIALVRRLDKGLKT